jgi:hypothetical protein
MLSMVVTFRTFKRYSWVFYFYFLFSSRTSCLCHPIQLFFSPSFFFFHSSLAPLLFPFFFFFFSFIPRTSSFPPLFFFFFHSSRAPLLLIRFLFLTASYNIFSASSLHYTLLLSLSIFCLSASFFPFFLFPYFFFSSFCSH